MKIGIVAGEKSGDYLGSELIRAIKQQVPHAQFIGLCGEQMKLQGAVSLAEMDKISIMGFDGLLGSLREILGIRKKLLTHFTNNPPDVFIGIDVPDFNLTLERKLKEQGIPVVHYVSPTVWAWRGGRIKKIRQAIDLMLTLYPFEECYYQKNNMQVKYVGHPLANELDNYQVAPDVKAQFSATGKNLIAILPGSRMSEVSRLADVMIEAANQLKAKNNELQFVIPAANQKIATYLQDKLTTNTSHIKVINGQSRELLSECHLAILASGTAALEAGLLAKPMVVLYKVSLLSLIMVKLTRTVDYFSMPNHLTSKPIVPELMQGDATVENLVTEMTKLLEDESYYKSVQNELATILPQLKADSGKLASDAIFELIASNNNAK